MGHPLSEKEILAKLKKAVDKEKRNVHWARVHHVDESLLSNVLSGKRPVSESVARGLGYTKRSYFVKITEVPDASE